MRIEEAIKFAEHAQTMTDIPEVKEFYAMAEKALRTQNQVNWVSVKDRLPEKHKLVLARAVSTARGGNITFVGAFDGFWFLQTAADTIGLTVQYDVTHWMPLPEPPEREGE